MSEPYRIADAMAANMGMAPQRPAVSEWAARVTKIRATYPEVTDRELAAMYSAHLDAIESRHAIAELRESVAMSVFKAHLALAGLTIVLFVVAVALR